MQTRMERYDVGHPERKEASSRTRKNEELYHDFTRNDTLYPNSDYVNTAPNAVAFSNLEQSYKTRESYHQIKEYEEIMPKPKAPSELTKYRTLYKDQENREYDINTVLVEAKKNRENKDDLERKRKLRNAEYNILTNPDLEEIEKYRKEKQDRIKENDVLTDLINTITSHTLIEKLSDGNDELMSDLLPNKENESVVTGTLSEDASSDIKDDKNELSNMDKSFYTKSMELASKDFVNDDDNDFNLDENNGSKHKFLKVLLFIILVAIISFVIYFVAVNYIL